MTNRYYVQGVAVDKLSPTRFLRHPSWALRLARNKIVSGLRWRRQRRPVNVPVVIKSGELLIYPDGQRVVQGWHFDLMHMAGPLYLETEDDYDHLWEALTAFATPKWIKPACNDMGVRS